MAAVTSAFLELPEKEFEVYAPQIVDLNGGAASQVLLAVPEVVMWGGENGSFAYVIKELIIIVTTAFAAAGVNNLLLGRSGASSAHHSYSTPDGQAAGTILRVDQAVFTGEERVLTTNKTLEIATTGALGAAGACRVGVKLSRRYNEWNGYQGNRL